MFEASINFDLENVQPFLQQLNTELHLDLPVSDLVAMTRNMDVEEETSTTFWVTFRGATVGFEYRVFMDDNEAPDLYLRTESKELADAIDAELTKFADTRGL